MKATAIVWSIWFFVFGSYATQMAKAFAPVPFSTAPHALSYLPSLSIVAGLGGFILYKTFTSVRRVEAPPAATSVSEPVEA